LRGPQPGGANSKEEAARAPAMSPELMLMP